jgi:hypothetical protein
MPDIRDVLKGLSDDDRALYDDVRTTMRRAYLSAHAKLLPIDQYLSLDDHFLDLIDIKVATLFDRAGVFDHSEGHLDTETGKAIETKVKAAGDSMATAMMKQPLTQNGGWTTNASNAMPKN